MVVALPQHNFWHFTDLQFALLAVRNLLTSVHLLSWKWLEVAIILTEIQLSCFDCVSVYAVCHLFAGKSLVQQEITGSKRDIASELAAKLDFLDFVEYQLASWLNLWVCHLTKRASFNFASAFWTHEVVRAIVALKCNRPNSMMQTGMIKNHVVTNSALDLVNHQVGIKLR